jgi:hypothetical protein
VRRLRALVWLLSLSCCILFHAGRVRSGPPFGKGGPPGVGPMKRGPKIGDKAPAFELQFLDSKEVFKLKENFGKRPTVLIFHSFT